MIDMRMAEHHRIDLCGIEREGGAVACFLSPAALKQAAVQQDLLIVDAQDMAGSCYSFAGTEELQFHHCLPNEFYGA